MKYLSNFFFFLLVAPPIANGLPVAEGIRGSEEEFTLKENERLLNVEKHNQRPRSGKGSKGKGTSKGSKSNGKGTKSNGSPVAAHYSSPTGYDPYSSPTGYDPYYSPAGDDSPVASPVDSSHLSPVAAPTGSGKPPYKSTKGTKSTKSAKSTKGTKSTKKGKGT
jgi:hypothetical protein